MSFAATPAGAPHRPSSRTLAVTVAVVAWLVAGAFGLSRYIANYQRYRGFPPPAHAAGIPAGRLVTTRIRSTALGRTADYVVYEPPGYAAAARGGRRFPVLYLLHAPPGSPTGFLTIGALGVRMDDAIAAHRIRPFLVVIPDGHTSRFGNDTEWANAAAGPYESFVLDIVRSVDTRYATLPTRGERAVAGLSEGGYGAANVALHQLATFGTFESWSGYFTQTPTQSFTGASAASLRANSPRAYVPALARQLRREPTWAFLYRGAHDRLTSRADTQAFAARLAAAGGHVTTAEYAGSHNWWLWRAHLPAMLRFASEHFRRSG
jgi:enterochelin esterase-like enzyme